MAAATVVVPFFALLLTGFALRFMVPSAGNWMLLTVVLVGVVLLGAANHRSRRRRRRLG